ncbi:hypothetical protein CBR_g54571 [Chara braunii]|uniref:Uncharacterized protein n=1 Tax=Chara braunii TaxID=69332 RepID=A0A388MC76_CHABU|nr:hypothetical protein CBR_g54571 [Chara braunii]|eukprot:GBG92174.1 hypothetical protein CBR_g54571 [Chara braunii]
MAGPLARKAEDREVLREAAHDSSVEARAMAVESADCSGRVRARMRHCAPSCAGSLRECCSCAGGDGGVCAKRRWRVSESEVREFWGEGGKGREVRNGRGGKWKCRKLPATIREEETSRRGNEGEREQGNKDEGERLS